MYIFCDHPFLYNAAEGKKRTYIGIPIGDDNPNHDITMVFTKAAEI